MCMLKSSPIVINTSLLISLCKYYASEMHSIYCIGNALSFALNTYFLHVFKANDKNQTKC